MKQELALLRDQFDQLWEAETKILCKIETWRGTDNEQFVKTNLRHCQTYISKLAAQTNIKLQNFKLTPFEWCSDGTTDEDGNVLGTHDPTEEQVDDSNYWVFGYRVGPNSAKYKLTLVCHLDTVPAEEGKWDPFDPQIPEEEIVYPTGTQSPQPFLIGRGCIDDKGPAVSAFVVVRVLALYFDSSDAFNTTQLEIVFDTSEETDMSTPKFWSDTSVETPTFGIVYDAMWCVRAEKGCERPVFHVPPFVAQGDGLNLTSLITAPNNSCNTIPDWAQAVISGSSAEIQVFQGMVESLFTEYVYPDDANYNRGILKVGRGDVDTAEHTLTLTIEVVGAQHGSAPDENRELGVNPLVSLSNFLAGITAPRYSTEFSFKNNCVTVMTKFIQWMWGTKVFGEHHHSMVANDSVFVKDNGTTYAVTKTSMEEDGGIKLELDMRYAIDHHSNGWDGETEGFLPGKVSIFDTVFGPLVDSFNNLNTCSIVKYDGLNTMFAPDIRNPEENENYKKAEQAYMDVMQTSEKPPRLAIGGGTDAKGNTTVLALGPLFSTKMGPPINYHGIYEGAPIADVRKSTEVMFRLCQLELLEPSAGIFSKKELETRKMHAVREYKELAKQGRKVCCNH